MKRKYKIELIIVSVIILVNSAFLVYQFRFNRKFMYERAHMVCEQRNYDEAIPHYVRLLQRYKDGKYVEEARRELFCKALPNATATLKAIDASVRLEAVESLIAALKDEDPSVRWGAAWALGGINDPRSVEPLISALYDQAPRVRLNSAWALGETKNPRVVEHLIERMKNDDDLSVRWHAAKALTGVGKAGVEALISLLTNKDASVRWTATLALKNRGAVGPLIAALGKENLSVRLGAARVLKCITKEDFGQDAGKWKKWWEQNEERMR